MLGMATVSGLTMSLGLLAFPDVASAAPEGRHAAPQAAAAKPAQPGRAAQPAANRTSPGKAPKAAAAKGQTRAAAVRNVPAAAAARSNRPGSPHRATGQVRAARVHALNAAAAAQRQPAGEAAPVAPVAPASSHQQAQPKVLLCHVTASETTPFSLIEVAAPAAVNAHLAHGDFAAVGGACPEPIVPPPPGETVTICHRTGVQGTPFALLTLNATDLPAHLAHGDVATVGGVCPGAVVLPQVLTPVVTPVVTPVRTAGVLPAAVSESTPTLIEQQLLAGKVKAVENRGALPVTGIDAGSTVLVGLAMLVVGGCLVRTARLRSARNASTASTATA